MLFWLCALDETREASNLRQRDKGCKKHTLKIVFCTIFWLYMVIAYAHIRMQERDDPTYEAAQEGDRYVAATAIGALLIVFYLIWFLYYTLKVRACESRIDELKRPRLGATTGSAGTSVLEYFAAEARHHFLRRQYGLRCDLLRSL